MSAGWNVEFETGGVQPPLKILPRITPDASGQNASLWNNQAISNEENAEELRSFVAFLLNPFYGRRQRPEPAKIKMLPGRKVWPSARSESAVTQNLNAMGRQTCCAFAATLLHHGQNNHPVLSPHCLNRNHAVEFRRAVENAT
jgi:hypothetical protein